jgi:hypothetical protein
VVNHATALHALIVAAANDPAVVNENRADRNAAFTQPESRFIDRCLEKLVDA